MPSNTPSHSLTCQPLPLWFGPLPLHASAGVPPFRFWWGRTWLYQFLKICRLDVISSAGMITCLVCCFKVPKNLSILPFCQGQATSVVWCFMPKNHKPKRNSLEVKHASLSVRRDLGCPYCSMRFSNARSSAMLVLRRTDIKPIHALVPASIQPNSLWGWLLLSLIWVKSICQSLYLGMGAGGFALMRLRSNNTSCL